MKPSRVRLAALVACGTLAMSALVQGAHATTVISAAARGFAYDYAHNHATTPPHSGFTVDYLSSGGGIAIFDYGTGSTEARSAVEFNISSLTNPVAAATLDLMKYYSNLPSAATLSVYGYTTFADGYIGTIDFWPGATLLGSFSYFNQASVNFDVTSFINSKISLGEDFVGLLLVWTSASQYGKYVIFNNPFPSSGPSQPAPTLTLELGEVPLPAALPLFVSGLGVMALLARRRKRKAEATLS